MSGHYRKEKNCLNCGHEVEFHYCSSCGQPNLELKEPFWHFMGHSVAHYFHFESKFWQTLIPLLTKPGQLTLDYLAGKRARYIHPVSLYIFISIIYFLIVPHALGEDEKEQQEQKKYTIASAIKENQQNNAKKAAAKKTLESNRKALDGISPIIGKKLDKEISPNDLISEDQFLGLTFTDQKIYLDSVGKVHAKTTSAKADNRLEDLRDLNNVKNDSTYTAYLARQKALPEDQKDSWYLQKTKRIDYGVSGKAKDHKLVNEEFKKYRPKQYFLLMPLLAFLIMVNFRKNKIYYINHLVFTIHGMTAFFIVSIVTQPLKKYLFGLDSGMSKLIEVAVFCGTVWYLYRGLKLFYNRSRVLTLRKTVTLVFLYTIALFISEAVIKGFIIYVMP